MTWYADSNSPVAEEAPVKAGAALLRYYDERLATYGDTPQGAGWPNVADRLTRFTVLLEIVDHLSPPGHVTLCDLACGTGELLRVVQAQARTNIGYLGVDLSDHALAMARSKYPQGVFHHIDALTAPQEKMELLRCDVLVANGLFTVKGKLSDAEMWEFMTATLRRIWPFVGHGIVFNLMSPVVDWRRDDLFHVSYDALAAFLQGLAGRRIGFRADYGLYEHMAFARKHP